MMNCTYCGQGIDVCGCIYKTRDGAKYLARGPSEDPHGWYVCLGCNRRFPQSYVPRRPKGKQRARLYAWYNFKRHLLICQGAKKAAMEPEAKVVRAEK